ncbi:MAG: recombinase family protein [Bryobacteraceae bacterium]
MQQPQRSAVLYARVSSKEQEQGYSIAAQQELLRSYAAQQGLSIQREFFDAETAKSTGRPAFAAMLGVLQKDPKCRVLLVEKTDRLYRNIKDWLTVDELDIEIHLVKENVVLTKDSRSSEKFMQGIKVLMAKNYIDNLSEEVRKGLRTKAAQGLYPSFAPPGYRNTVRPDGKRVIVPDPAFGPIVTKLFGWFATGEYSLKALARKAWEEGFRFRKSESKVPVTTLHKILRKRIYTGEFEYGGVTYQGSHEPLVAREVWERVQEILDGRHGKKHRKMHHSFPFSGLVSCGHCGCSLVGEMKKQRYVYYHCTGYRGKCPEPYTREETLEEQFADHLRGLVIPPAVLTWLQAELVASDCTERAAREQELRREQRELERLQTRLDVLYDDRLDGRIDAATYDRRATEIREQQQRARQRASAGQVALPPASEALDLMVVTSKAAELFLRQPAAEQRRLLHVVLKAATWKSGELRMSLREPFEQLRLSNSATHTNRGHFGGDNGLSGIWRRGGDSNPR